MVKHTNSSLLSSVIGQVEDALGVNLSLQVTNTSTGDFDLVLPPPTAPAINQMLQTVNDEVVKEASVEEPQRESLGILLFLLSVLVALMLSYCLKRLRIKWLHETGAALLFGCACGLLLKETPNSVLLNLLGFEDTVALHESLLFQNDVFFLVLLPPIIFEAGFNTVPTMLRKKFWGNLDGICAYAFIGTLISTFITGIGVHTAGLMGVCLQLPMLNAMAFGTLISATDPVTTLSLFQELGVDLDLYGLVFGEAVLNDAVAITLYTSIINIQNAGIVDGSVLGQAFMDFWISFFGSVLVGVVIALVTSLLLKHTFMSHEEFAVNEAGIVAIMPYLSYIIATSVDLSGIIAILFCGIAMARYTVKHLSAQAYHSVHNFYKLIASLFEMFIFIYMGVAIFGFKLPWGKHIPLAVVSLASCLIARWVHVHVCTKLINSWRSESHRVPPNFTTAIWFSGLRGPIAFALALSTHTELTGDTSEAILTSTIAVIVCTVLVNGGYTPTLLDKLDLKVDPNRPNESDPDRVRPHEARPAVTPTWKMRTVLYLMDLEQRFQKFMTSRRQETGGGTSRSGKDAELAYLITDSHDDE
mmetsp:Transcript_13179/g.25148  ORF Transcript_13179/g.25148 Transcript_13179/m.25148 type:complete len:586 (-) Transcript_13179:225-1982(-)|eukprot:CAMPEP_0114245926 /NCGR_PEP_ID=MMETSP0058-20121206/12172_1 /TAXON_ID=36894 /ORGANISM="Pyramimonas parkeae, CCMP726" /LENGTH=585 /DNA_ID=CAMNT_0001359043 /DNA_START=658 /DNA_END=2415 /DNA_ORIENTATION=+